MGLLSRSVWRSKGRATRGNERIPRNKEQTTRFLLRFDDRDPCGVLDPRRLFRDGEDPNFFFEKSIKSASQTTRTLKIFSTVFSKLTCFLFTNERHISTQVFRRFRGPFRRCRLRHRPRLWGWLLFDYHLLGLLGQTLQRDEHLV